jgi:choline dehydrogenase-like flavoprotein
MIIVVGSGPSAVAAINALVEQGHEVTVLDVGARLETERRVVAERMSTMEPSDWTQDDLNVMEGSRTLGREAVHSKQSFGSSYSFASSSSAIDIRWKGQQGFSHSLALGGLSNVWGAVLLPYRAEDIADWPISLADLIPHYKAVMEFVPCTAVVDGLEELLPSYCSRPAVLEPSAQAAGLLDDLEKQRQPLKQQGIHFGRSRLAINASGDLTHRACAYCTLCLSGCPYGLIYSSAQTLAALIETGKVTYHKDHLVEKVQDLGSEVCVSGLDLASGRPFHFQASRVLIGAGVLPTAKIILNSLQVFDKPVMLKDSQYFIYPMLRFGRVDDVEEERSHTSAQVFLEIDDPRVSQYLVHIQIYGFSAFLLRELNRTFLKWPLRIRSFRRQFLGRLMIAQGFLHSEESGRILLTLKKTGEGSSSLDVHIIKSPSCLATLLRVGRKLLKQAFKIRALPLIPGLKIPLTGSGYHSGGTFPMAENPGGGETDTLGRLPTMPRVHLVDSSVFPSIPATSITFTVMANAHRIATAAGKLDRE